MALTVARVTGNNPDYVDGNKRIKYRDVTFDNSYTTGGVSLTPAMVNLKTISFVAPGAPAKNAAGTLAYFTQYDYTNQKLLAYTAAASPSSAVAMAEANSTKDLSTFTVRLRFEGN